jgi:hypothetical protein
MILGAILVAGCAGRMPAEEFDRLFGVPANQTSVPVAREDGHDSDQARRFAARRYLEVTGVERIYDNMLHEAAKELPEARRHEFFQLAARVLPRDSTHEFLIDLCVKYFTRRQLDALTDFYRTGEGRSIAARGILMAGPAVPSEGPWDTPQDRRVAAQRYLFEVNGKRLYGEIRRHSREAFLVRG